MKKEIDSFNNVPELPTLLELEELEDTELEQVTGGGVHICNVYCVMNTSPTRPV